MGRVAGRARRQRWRRALRAALVAARMSASRAAAEARRPMPDRTDSPRRGEDRTASAACGRGSRNHTSKTDSTLSMRTWQPPTVEIQGNATFERPRLKTRPDRMRTEKDITERNVGAFPVPG